MATAPIRSFTTDEAPPDALVAIRRLMDEAFEGEFTEEDWEHTIGGRHVVVEESGVVVAHASVIQRTIEVGGRPFRTGYVEGVATRPPEQGRGLGSLAMDGTFRLRALPAAPDKAASDGGGHRAAGRPVPHDA